VRIAERARQAEALAQPQHGLEALDGRCAVERAFRINPAALVARVDEVIE
jgi:hypothetical protein